MEYTQERIATLHQLTRSGVESSPHTDTTPDHESASLIDETAIVVPMTDREHASLAAERVLTELETIDPAHVFVPVRAPPDRVEPFRTWLESFSLSLSVLWCNAPDVDDLLTDAGLANGFGKGRDVWLALGPAATACEYVVVHDADASSYEAAHVHRLLAPLTMDSGFSFVKGYYARVENSRLYGRLFRLLYEPLVRALESGSESVSEPKSTESHDDSILEYLGAFRYALAGEVAMTADLATRLRPPRAWGLEISTLGDAFAYAGFEGTAQVDLGRHEHDHRSVAGETGLEGMSREVTETLCRVLEDHGVEIDYETLAERYRETGRQLIDQYHADALFNGLSYDATDERQQVDRYAASIRPPGADRRLPPWTEAPFSPEAVRMAATPWLSGE